MRERVREAAARATDAFFQITSEEKTFLSQPGYLCFLSRSLTLVRDKERRKMNRRRYWS
jgi:hypothetical protein